MGLQYSRINIFVADGIQRLYFHRNRNLGIGVDVHVHRIANRLGWVKTEKDGPEGTREVSIVNENACTIRKCFESTSAMSKVLINSFLVTH